MRTLWIYVLTLWPVTATAGTISGGGGGLSRYQSNPWFLANTSNVTYCIEQDPQTFNIEPELAKRHIREAFVYWAGFFRRWEASFQDLKFKVATQNFIFSEACSEMTDIKFQLGKLHPDQKAVLGDPSLWAGIAAMTSYDLKHLRAKGFIYLGANAGEDRMNGSYGVDQEPWVACDGLAFRLVVLHEIGHIFGLQHNALSILMRDQAPEHIVSRVFADGLRDWQRQGRCDVVQQAYEQDIFYVRNLSPGNKFSIYPSSTRATLAPRSDWKELRLELEDGASLFLKAERSLDHLVSISLPPKQLVFVDELFSIESYPGIRHLQWKGSYVKDGKSNDAFAYAVDEEDVAMNLVMFSGNGSVRTEKLIQTFELLIWPSKK